MSPKIGISIQTRTWAEKRTPAQVVLAAVAEARTKALKLHNGTTGVTAGRLSDVWVPDRGSVPAGVSVIGAVLLALQPTPIEDEDPSASVARALGVSLAWAEGCSDGWDRETHASYWVGGAWAEDYVSGYEAGIVARFNATIVCGKCSKSRYKGELSCPGCGAR